MKSFSGRYRIIVLLGRSHTKSFTDWGGNRNSLMAASSRFLPNSNKKRFSFMTLLALLLERGIFPFHGSLENTDPARLFPPLFKSVGANSLYWVSR